MSKGKTFLLAILFSWAAQEAFSTPVSIETARKVAQNLYSEAVMLKSGSLPGALDLSNVITIGDPQKPLIFVFNLPEDAGFVMVAGDDASYPVLGYALSGNFSAGPESWPEGFTFLMESYQWQLSALLNHGVTRSPLCATAWDYYIKEPFTARSNVKWVGPLLTTIWDQKWPYNALVPKDKQGRTLPAGCASTAFAQACNSEIQDPGGQTVHIGGNSIIWSNDDLNTVMDATGSDGKKNAVYDSINFQVGDTIRFDYSKMPDIATADNYDEIAKLILCCGVAAQTQYRFSSSGAHNTPVRDAMVKRFGFSPNAELVYKANYTDEKWKQLLQTELDMQRPVFYSGVDSVKDVGHAFVCDGYQLGDFFHINWGWSGQYNGYFYLSDLSPGTSDYAQQQAAIVGLRPDNIKCTPPLHLKATVDSNHVALKWSVPSLKPITEWMHYDSTFGSSWRFGSDLNYSVAIRFDTAQLAAHHGLQLTKIRLLARNDAASYRLKVWKGENASSLVLDQAISMKKFSYWVSLFGDTLYDYNTFLLDQPIVIDAGEELWIGYSVENQVAGKYPVCTDDGPAVQGYGDMICFDGGYWNSASLMYSNWSHNWSIRAFVTDVYGNSYSVNPAPAKVPYSKGIGFENTCPETTKSAVPAGILVAGKSTADPQTVLARSREYEPVLLGYNVFREGVQLNSQPLAQLTYSDEGLAPGTYFYTVTAVYDSGVSVSSGPAKATVGNQLNPPVKLVASRTEKDVQLNWSKPLPPLTEKWLNYDDGTYFTGIGLNNGGSFKVSIRYTPEQLAEFAGLYISKIRLYTLTENTTYKLFIATGANAENIVTSFKLPGLLTGQWDVVALAKPILIDVTKELWIGYQVIDHPAGEFPAGADNGPGTSGSSDMISINGTTFVSLYSINSEWDYNWNIQALLTNRSGTKSALISEGPSALRLMGYNLYCNYRKVNADVLLDTLWLDAGLKSGTYNYYVKALYNEGESSPSNVVTISYIDATGDEGAVPGLLLYPVPASGFVVVETRETFNQIIMYDMLGKVVYQSRESGNKLTVSTQGYHPGMYLLQIKTGNGTISAKVSVQ